MDEAEKSTNRPWLLFLRPLKYTGIPWVLF